MAKRPKYRPMERRIEGRLQAVEAIEAFYEKKGDVALPMAQDVIRSRWESAYQMFLRDKDASFDRIATIRKHARVWKQSEIQSRRDLDAAMDLFGKIDTKNKTTHRAIAIEMSLKTYRLAERKGELGEMNRANKIYMEATGVDKEDPNVPKAEDLKIPIIEIADELTRLLMERIGKAAMSGNTIDLQELKVIDLIEGIDFQMISDFLPPQTIDNANK